jgi:hypothetical protein
LTRDKFHDNFAESEGPTLSRKSRDGALAAAKNLVRPFINQPKQNIHRAGSKFQRAKPIAANIQQLRRSFPYEQAELVLKYVEDNPLLPFDGIGSTTPRIKVHLPDSRLGRVQSLPLPAELRLARCRLSYHQEIVCEMLERLAGIDTAILAKDYSGADVMAAEFTEKFGYSLCVLKRRLLISLLRGGLTGLHQAYNTFCEEDAAAYSVLAHMFYDYTDPSYDIDRSISTWLRPLGKLTADDSWYTRVFYWELLGEVESLSSLSDTVLRYSFVSLVDFTIMLWQCSIFYSERTESENITFLPPTIHAKMEQLFSTGQLPSSSPYADEDESIRDVELFRLCFFFREYKNILIWHNDISQLFIKGRFSNSPLSTRLSNLTMSAGALSADPAIFSQYLVAIGQWCRTILPTKASLRSQKFVLALAGAEFLRKVVFEYSTNERVCCDILASADGYYEYISNQALRDRATEAEAAEHKVLAYLLRDSIFRQTRSADDDLERRIAFMDIFVSKNSQAIVKLIEETSTWSSLTARTLAKTCTRSFLERLFLIMESVKDVIETRLAIVRWQITDDSTETKEREDELKSLQTELDNLDVRSDLDSTRVHVDEDSLREWFRENEFALVGRYTQTVLSEGPDYDRETFLSNINRLYEGKGSDSEEFLKNIQINAESILLRVLEDTLKSFVSDRVFGLDAYLSRRIRHGTLSGFLITPLNRILKSDGDAVDSPSARANESEARGARAALAKWQQGVAEALDLARREILQVKSADHSDGLFEASWRSASGVIHIDATFSKIRAGVIRTRGKYDIFDDIYALCWDLIERDLAKVRYYFLRKFYKVASEELDQVFAEMPHAQQVSCWETAGELRRSLHSRTLEVCGWFIRPVFRQESYDLRTLVQSLISVLRDLDDQASFTEILDIDSSLSISRGSFEIIGDVLFVIIGNAAKHGSKGGDISVEAHRAGQDERAVQLRVTSTVIDADAFDLAESRIREAAQITSGQELHDASVQEGFSGIRKVLLTLSRADSRCRWGFGRDTRTIVFDFAVPRDITYRRGR